ncbi:sigma-70 family RNA polymerase sigma factor [Acidithiobacillus sp. AMEEHan]|uniref:sigma-70 family RNA polymerase sigma factor n=1 Tax=Acidithiobacillus sp. AMEEHan TaxID=2994951 RepID=UPI0027E43D5E|nr:sigma-70 family RNA polymerase sigma factor [Acidithiobacillus sp. AMEEHan]
MGEGDALSEGAVPCALLAWQQTERELHSFLRRELSALADPWEADDLLHEIFLRLLRQGGRFCAVENTRAWLFQVARNLLVDYQRRARPSSELSEDLAMESEEPSPLAELAECLPVAMAGLSDEDRDAITQCDLSGLGQAEYARSLGLSLPAVKSRLQRARARLRAELLDHCGVRFHPDTGQVCCHGSFTAKRGKG